MDLDYINEKDRTQLKTYHDYKTDGDSSKVAFFQILYWKKQNSDYQIYCKLKYHHGDWTGGYWMTSGKVVTLKVSLILI